MDNIEVLVCDDSSLMRNMISRIVDSAEGMHTAGTAMNGKFCLQKIPLLKPDLILLDIEMPEMTGVQFLEERKKLGIDIPVIILSSIATKGAAVTMQCLELGASDFITKPGGSVSVNITSVGSSIIEKIASYGGKYARAHGKNIASPEVFVHQAKLKEAEAAAVKEGIISKIKPSETKPEPLPATLWTPPHKEPAVITPLRQSGPIDVVALGISTGGPNALREVFAKIDPKFSKPILVVQHMPAGFTKDLAARTGTLCAGTRPQDADKASLAAAQIGAGFQIIDDVINLTTGNPGKKRGDDIVEGKKSLPVLLLAEQCPQQMKKLHTLFKQARSGGIESPAVEEAISVLTDSGTILQARDRGIKLIQDACEKFDALFGSNNEESAKIRQLFMSMIPQIQLGEAKNA